MKLLNKYKNIYIRVPIQVKAAFWLTFCSFLQKGISVITVPIFTRIMSESEYGLVSVFTSWSNIIGLFTSLSLSSGAFNPAMMKFNDKRNSVVSSFLGLSTVINVITFIIYLIFRNKFNEIIGINTFLMCVMFIQLLLSPAFNLWLSKERFEYNYKPIVIIVLVSSILAPLISFIAVILSPQKAAARITASEIVNCLFYLIIFLMIFVKGKQFYNREYWKYGFKINLPLIPHFLSGSILNQADRIMINKYCGAGDAGIYSVAYSASMLMTIINGSINASLVPWTYEKIKAGKIKEIKKISNYLVLIIAVLTALFVLLAPEIIKILAPSGYYSAIWVVPPVSISVYFLFVYSLFVNIEMYYEKSWNITISSIVAAIINIILNYIFIPIYGFIAAGYTTLVSYVIYTILHYYYVKVIVKENKIKESFFDIKFIIIVSVILMLILIISIILYNYLLLRYCLLLIIIFIALMKYKEIANVIMSLRNKSS